MRPQDVSKVDEIKIFAISILMIQQVWRCQGGKIGITLNINWMEPRDPSDEADVEASEESLALLVSWFIALNKWLWSITNAKEYSRETCYVKCLFAWAGLIAK